MPNAIYRNLDGSIGQDITDLGNSFVSATLSGGIILYGGTLMSVDTEGGASVDELVTIGNGGTGKLLLLRSQSLARRVVLKHGTGNIWCAGGDVLLDDPNKLIMLVYNGANWVVIGQDGIGAALAFPPDSCAFTYADFDNPTLGAASINFPSADRPFGVYVPTLGGIGSSTGGRTLPGVAKSTTVNPGLPIGEKRECTVIADYGVEAPCTISRVRFWYRGASSDMGTQVGIFLRFFDVNKAQVGNTHTFYGGSIRQNWTLAEWNGEISGVRYVVATHEGAPVGSPSLYIDEFEIN